MADNILHYSTASGRNAKDLNEDVNSMLAKGYQPFGSPYIAEDWILQAMVRTKPVTADSTEITADSNIPIA